MSCKCDLRTRAVGDGCRYCNPQEYIDKLHEQDADYKSEIANLEQQLRNTLALVEKKNEALMLQASHMEMYSLQISHANDYAKITRAIDLEPEDVELVEVNHVDYVEVDPAHYDVVSTLDDGEKLYKIQMKGK